MFKHAYYLGQAAALAKLGAVSPEYLAKLQARHGPDVLDQIHRSQVAPQAAIPPPTLATTLERGRNPGRNFAMEAAHQRKIQRVMSGPAMPFVGGWGEYGGAPIKGVPTIGVGGNASKLAPHGDPWSPRATSRGIANITQVNEKPLSGGTRTSITPTSTPDALAWETANKEHQSRLGTARRQVFERRLEREGLKAPGVPGFEQDLNQMRQTTDEARQKAWQREQSIRGQQRLLRERDALHAASAARGTSEATGAGIPSLRRALKSLTSVRL